jgi:hypothetical protein
MHPRSRTVRRALGLGLLVMLVVLVPSACGGVEKEAEVPHLPDEAKALQPGEYRSEEFEPSFSFRIGKGWKNDPPEAFDFLLLGQKTGGLGAVNVQRVYEPSKSGTPIVVHTPKNLVGWLEHHSYLKTSDPKPVSVGGVEGQQVDVAVANDLPGDYHSGLCSPIADSPIAYVEECVDLFRVSTHHSPIFVSESDELRLIVLQNELSGQTVALGYVSRATSFDEFAPEAQKVIDTVKWRSP